MRTTKMEMPTMALLVRRKAARALHMVLQSRFGLFFSGSTSVVGVADVVVVTVVLSTPCGAAAIFLLIQILFFSDQQLVSQPSGHPGQGGVSPLFSHCCSPGLAAS